MIPNTYKLQYSKEQIKEAVSRIGKQIAEWAKAVQQLTQKEVVAIPVLRGGIFFFADLARKVPASLEIVPGRSRAYQINQNAAQLDRVKITIENENLKDRSILLVDDICDSGRTMHSLKNYLIAEGVSEVKSAVLIHRLVEDSLFTPDWVGFEYKGDDWFVGYGMEDHNRWSNLPDIYTIPPK